MGNYNNNNNSQTVVPHRIMTTGMGYFSKSNSKVSRSASASPSPRYGLIRAVM